MEGLARDAIEDRFDVLYLRTLHAGGLGEHLLFRRSQDAIQSPEDSQGKDDAAVLRGLVRPAKELGDTPDELDLLGEVFHG